MVAPLSRGVGTDNTTSMILREEISINPMGWLPRFCSITVRCMVDFLSDIGLSPSILSLSMLSI